MNIKIEYKVEPAKDGWEVYSYVTVGVKVYRNWVAHRSEFSDAELLAKNLQERMKK